MELLEIGKQICHRTGDNVLRSVFSNEDNASELLGYISQAANEIAGQHNWSGLKKNETILTSGGRNEYDLPDDFDSILTFHIYNITKNLFIPFSSDDNEMARIAGRDTSQNSLMFRIMGGKIVFTYPIDDGQELKYVYKSKNFVKDTEDLSYRDHFAKDTDKFVLDDELLILKSMSLRAVNLGLSEAQQREAAYLSRLEKKMANDGGLYRGNIFETQDFNKTTPIDWGVYGK